MAIVRVVPDRDADRGSDASGPCRWTRSSATTSTRWPPPSPPRTRLVFVCTPNNPTGTAVRRDEFERFLARGRSGRARRARRGLPRVRDRSRRRRRRHPARRAPQPRRAAHLLEGVSARRPAGGVFAEHARGGAGAAQGRIAVRRELVAQAAAIAALDCRAELLAACAEVEGERERVRAALLPRVTRCRRRRPTSSGWRSVRRRLRSRPTASTRRWSSGRGSGEGVRVTVSTPEENDALLAAALSFPK